MGGRGEDGAEPELEKERRVCHGLSSEMGRKREDEPGGTSGMAETTAEATAETMATVGEGLVVVKEETGEGEDGSGVKLR